MFGYVIADYSKLSAQDKALYKSHYCGLCRALSTGYGAAARWLVSYDTAFLSVMLCSMKENPCDCALRRCPYHAGQKRRCVQGDIADYCADVTVILAYLNMADDVEDGGSVLARAGMRLYKTAFEKARMRLPELCASIKDRLCQLSEVQKRGETDYMIPADIFGCITGEVFAYDSRARDFGYALGRAIYILDAASDFEGDVRKGRYNPLIRARVSDFDGIVGAALGHCASEYEKLELARGDSLCDNIIYRGMWLKYEFKKKLRGR